MSSSRQYLSIGVVLWGSDEYDYSTSIWFHLKENFDQHPEDIDHRTYFSSAYITEKQWERNEIPSAILAKVLPEFQRFHHALSNELIVACSNCNKDEYDRYKSIRSRFRFSCRPCDFDLCENCFFQQQPPQCDRCQNLLTQVEGKPSWFKNLSIYYQYYPHPNDFDSTVFTEKPSLSYNFTPVKNSFELLPSSSEQWPDLLYATNPSKALPPSSKYHCARSTIKK